MAHKHNWQFVEYAYSPTADEDPDLIKFVCYCGYHKYVKGKGETK